MRICNAHDQIHNGFKEPKGRFLKCVHEHYLWNIRESAMVEPFDTSGNEVLLYKLRREE